MPIYIVETLLLNVVPSRSFLFLEVTIRNQCLEASKAAVGMEDMEEPELYDPVGPEDGFHWSAALVYGIASIRSDLAHPKDYWGIVPGEGKAEYGR